MKKVTLEAQTHYVEEDSSVLFNELGQGIELRLLRSVLKAKVEKIADPPYNYMYGDAVQHRRDISLVGKFVGKAPSMQGHSIIEVYREHIGGYRYRLWANASFEPQQR